MKSLKYVTLAALLLASLTAGCKNGWNPFKKKPPAQPPLASRVDPMDSTGAGADAPRPDGDVTIIEPAPKGTPLVQPPPPDTPKDTGKYVIQKIDKGGYYAIARRELGDVTRWKEIKALNPGVDPTKLRVGQVINIPPR
jgi:nucleoid-associated protein YgaU